MIDMSIVRIASPKILLWQKRCLMRESYQPPEMSISRELEGREAMMSLASRRELLAVTAPMYRTARGSERSRILEEFVASTDSVAELLKHVQASALLIF